MKIMILICSTLLAFTAVANEQSLNCREKTGGKVHLTLKLNKNGKVARRGNSVTVTGFAKKGQGSLLETLTVQGINQGNTLKEKKPYTTIFLDDSEGILDVQLQFDRHVTGEEFRDQAATFVIGNDDASPEFSFAYGYPVLCNSTVR